MERGDFGPRYRVADATLCAGSVKPDGEYADLVCAADVPVQRSSDVGAGRGLGIQRREGVVEDGEQHARHTVCAPNLLPR